MELAYRTVLINLVTRPFRAFCTIYSYDLYRYKYLFFGLIGIAQVLDRRLYEMADSRYDLTGQLFTNIWLGALIGWFGIALFSGLIYFSGSYLKGRATLHEMFNITSYASLPVVFTLISTLICILLLRYNGYTDDNYPHNWANLFYRIDRVNFYINVAVNLYYLMFMVIAISVAQGFTILKSILNLIAAIAVVLVPLAFFIGLWSLMHR